MANENAYKAGRNSRRLCRLVPQNCALLVCDMQEKFRPAILHFDEIVKNTSRLVDSCKLLGVPIMATEQYPKGLGPTVSEIGLMSLGIMPVSKTCFTMAVPQIIDQLKTKHPQVDTVILCGVEAHVCIQATTIDFLERSFSVHVVVDCSSSRSVVDRMFAFDRIKEMGAFLNTAESVILNLAGDSRHPQFKNLQKIISETGPDTGLAQSLGHQKSSL